MLKLVLSALGTDSTSFLHDRKPIDSTVVIITGFIPNASGLTVYKAMRN